MSIHPDVKIGHVHLTVANLEKSLSFYRDILGFEVVTQYGDSAVFLSAGGYHHHIGLNTWKGKGVTPPPANHSGLYHFAILFPSRTELAKIIKRLIDAKYPIQGASDHGVSEAIYVTDPDMIGVELYCDRPEADWSRDAEGKLEMISKPLDLDSLLSELEA